VRLIQQGFPAGLKFMIRGVTAEDDKIAAEVESLGTHISGKVYNNKYHFLMVINERNNLIVSVKEYMNTLTLLKLLTP